MEDLLNKAPCGFLAFADDGTIMEVNQTLLSMLRYEREALLGTKIERLFTIAGRIFYQTHFYPLIKLQGKAEEIFLTLQASNSEAVAVLAFAKRELEINHCVVVPVHQRQKYEEEILAAKRKAEEALRSNAELIQAKAELTQQTIELDRRMDKLERMNQELLQVTKILFHDVREPLRKIESFATLIRDEESTGEEIAHYLSRIQNACRRMNELVRALQQFVSVEAPEDRYEAVDLRLLAEEAFRTAKAAHPERAATLENEGLPVIEGYPRQLHLLFCHLFEDAFEPAESNPPLHFLIRANLVQHNSYRAIQDRYRYVDFVQIFFNHNGPPIAETLKESIFTLLNSVDPDRPRIGCGFAICKKVIENHFGSLTVGQGNAEGTQLKILLPLKKE